MSGHYDAEGDGESCSHHCGYVSSGRDLAEHEIHEHRPCPDCRAGPGQDLEVYGLTHKLDCLRLKPGHVYPPGPESERLDAWYDEEPS